jgi:hypothetical protein
VPVPPDELELPRDEELEPPLLDDPEELELLLDELEELEELEELVLLLLLLLLDEAEEPELLLDAGEELELAMPPDPIVGAAGESPHAASNVLAASAAPPESFSRKRRRSSRRRCSAASASFDGEGLRVSATESVLH